MICASLKGLLLFYSKRTVRVGQLCKYWFIYYLRLGEKNCWSDGGDRSDGDLAETMRVFYRSRDEMKSEDRDEWMKYLKFAGEYEENMDA